MYNLPSRLDWTHVVLNYMGPEDGTQGIRVYFNGELGDTDTAKYGQPREPGEGRVVLGRAGDEDYASVGVDELLFFNQKLNDDEILTIKNIV